MGLTNSYVYIVIIDIFKVCKWQPNNKLREHGSAKELNESTGIVTTDDAKTRQKQLQRCIEKNDSK